jgi:glucose/arabinose dehydrogenase
VFLSCQACGGVTERFDEEKFADVPAPTALDFTPNARLLVTSKPGQLYVVDGGVSSKALDLGPNVCSNSERGLLGVAFDPDAAGTSFRINDVGGQSWEEIDRARAGADYG